MNAPMLHAMTPPLAPFVDALPLPSRLIASERDGRLTVRIRAGEHRFHRDLPVSSIWGFEGMVPGPTIEAEGGRPVTVETLCLGRLYVLFFIELDSRRVHVAGCTANPDGRWTTQQARQLAWSFSERATPARFLIHDRDSKFSRAFDEVFHSEASRSSAPRFVPRRRTRSPNVGSAPSAATASTGC